MGTRVGVKVNGMNAVAVSVLVSTAAAVVGLLVTTIVGMVGRLGGTNGGVVGVAVGGCVAVAVSWAMVVSAAVGCVVPVDAPFATVVWVAVSTAFPPCDLDLVGVGVAESVLLAVGVLVDTTVPPVPETDVGLEVWVSAGFTKFAV